MRSGKRLAPWVYLRARGGAQPGRMILVDDGGLSPRTRRNRLLGQIAIPDRGSISAHAEEPRRSPSARFPDRVYLRARGGTRLCSHASPSRQALSPRTRRNPTIHASNKSANGSISAHAEEPNSNGRSTGKYEVYLRARGGTTSHIGVRPALRGLSPRTRRNPHHRRQNPVSVWSISAHAEEPSLRRRRDSALRVYLRARGGTNTESHWHCRGNGLSPRTRRNRRRGRRTESAVWSISAHAEEPDG